MFKSLLHLSGPLQAPLVCLCGEPNPQILRLHPLDLLAGHPGFCQRSLSTVEALQVPGKAVTFHTFFPIPGPLNGTNAVPPKPGSEIRARHPRSPRRAPSSMAEGVRAWALAARTLLSTAAGGRHRPRSETRALAAHSTGGALVAPVPHPQPPWQATEGPAGVCSLWPHSCSWPALSRGDILLSTPRPREGGPRQYTETPPGSTAACPSQPAPDTRGVQVIKCP